MPLLHDGSAVTEGSFIRKQNGRKDKTLHLSVYGFRWEDFQMSIMANWEG